MKLIELNPRWWNEPGRFGQGVLFRCPCCTAKPILPGKAPCLYNNPQCADLAIAFSNPLDGGEVFPINKQAILWAALKWNVGDATHPAIIPPGVHWTRKGDTFETLSISPSVDASASGHWHGFVTDGSCA